MYRASVYCSVLQCCSVVCVHISMCVHVCTRSTRAHLIRIYQKQCVLCFYVLQCVVVCCNAAVCCSAHVSACHLCTHLFHHFNTSSKIEITNTDGHRFESEVRKHQRSPPQTRSQTPRCDIPVKRKEKKKARYGKISTVPPKTARRHHIAIFLQKKKKDKNKNICMVQHTIMYMCVMIHSSTHTHTHARARAHTHTQTHTIA